MTHEYFQSFFKEKKKKLRQKGDTEENETNSFYNNIDNFKIHQHIKFLKLILFQ